MTSVDEVRAASEIEDPIESVRAIKSVAARVLANADKDAELVTTSNFNHSYLPDFVLEWRGGTREDRHVFLRASRYADEIEEDVRTLSERRPIFLQLNDLTDAAAEHNDPVNDGDLITSLRDAAVTTRSLVTSIEAIQRFSAPSINQTGGILSSYVLKGGQGLVADETAKESALQIDRGFSGAIELDRDATSEALDVVQTLLDVPSATQFSRLLEAAWISGGGAAVEFPGAVASLGEKVSPQLLRELFRIVPEELEEFWGRLGSAVDNGSFVGLHRIGEDRRLQMLMVSALPNLRAKSILIRRNALAVADDDPFMWQIDDGRVSLQGRGFRSWFIGAFGAPRASLAKKFEVAEPPSISNVSNRASNADIALVGISVSDGERSVKFSSQMGDSIADDDLLEEIGTTMGSSALVQDAEAVVGGRALKFDFTRGSAGLHTRADLALQDMGWGGWNLLVDLKNEDIRDELRNALLVAIDDDSDSVDQPIVTAYVLGRRDGQLSSTDSPLQIEQAPDAEDLGRDNDDS